jgi:hypothetical protein
MKIYLAGASKEIDNVKRYRDAVISLGHEITHDWIADIEREASKGVTDHDLTDDEARRYAQKDLRGIASADLFWFLLPGLPSPGAWFEFGFAVRMFQGTGFPKLIVSGYSRGRIFTRLPGVERFETHDAALLALQAYGSTT